MAGETACITQLYAALFNAGTFRSWVGFSSGASATRAKSGSSQPLCVRMFVARSVHKPCILQPLQWPDTPIQDSLFWVRIPGPGPRGCSDAGDEGHDRLVLAVGLVQGLQNRRAGPLANTASLKNAKWGFRKIKGPFGSPYNEDQSALGSTSEPLFIETPKSVESIVL